MLGVGDALVCVSIHMGASRTYELIAIGGRPLVARCFRKTMQASIVGKRLGRHRWFAANPKTIEGSAAFVTSVCVCAWLLRVCGVAEDFSVRDSVFSSRAARYSVDGRVGQMVYALRGTRLRRRDVTG